MNTKIKNCNHATEKLQKHITKIYVECCSVVSINYKTIVNFKNFSSYLGEFLDSNDKN